MYILMIQLLTLMALTLVHLAHEYQTDGYGLSPVIAFPIATLMIVLPLAWEFVEWLRERYEDEYEHIELEHAHCGRCGRLTDLINGQCSVGCAWSTREDRARG